MANPIVSRSAFCTSCYTGGHPAKDDIYVLFGTQTQSFELYTCDHNSPELKKGFTPHLFEKLAVQTLPSGIHVHYLRTCGICGIEINYTQDKTLEVLGTVSRKGDDGKPFKLYLQRLRWMKGLMAVNHWNALIKDWKETNYELDDWKYRPT